MIASQLIQPSARAALEHYKIRDTSKGMFSFASVLIFHSMDRKIGWPIVVVKFKSIGSAPIMKTTVFKVTASNRFQAVIVFLRGQLGFKATDPLVSYRPDFMSVECWKLMIVHIYKWGFCSCSWWYCGESVQGESIRWMVLIVSASVQKVIWSSIIRKWAI